MSKTCPACNKTNPDSSGFCDDCGAEIPAASVAPSDVKVAPSAPDPGVADGSTAAPACQGGDPAPAHLTFKRFGVLSKDVIPLQASPLVVGRFDASSGPVDIDLTSLPGGENVSRQHAEVFFQGGSWMVREVSSTNGVFVKRAGETAFSPRLQTPTDLRNGDEVAFGNLAFVFNLG